MRQTGNNDAMFKTNVSFVMCTRALTWSVHNVLKHRFSKKIA